MRDHGIGDQAVMPDAHVRIGTCSWKFPSWAGLVYSRTGDINYLSEYARVYDTVEIDQWFWSLFDGSAPVLPRAETVQDYVASVGPEFRFTVKAPNSITLTHYYNKGPRGPLKENPHFLSDELWEAFIASLAPMLPQVSMIMLQFEYLNRMKMRSLPDFLSRLQPFLARHRDRCPIGVEIRNPNYLRDEFFTALDAAGVSPVLVHGYYMPPVWETYSAQRERISRHCVLRLLGPDRKGIEEETGKRWDSVVQPREDEFEAIGGVIRDLLGRGIDATLNVNNHYEGSAPRTISRIRPFLRLDA